MHSGSASLGGFRSGVAWRRLLLLVALVPLIGPPSMGAEEPPDAVSEAMAEKIRSSAADDDAEEADDDGEASPTAEEQLTEAIRRSLSKLTGGTAEYDGTTLTVTYADGDAFRSDLEWISPVGKPNFERRSGQIFAGHTEGQLLLKPHFRGKVRFEAKITYQWIERGKSHFMMLVHASPTEFLGSNFGVHTVSKIGKKRLKQRPSKDRSHRKDASQWVDRTGGHVQVVEFEGPNLLRARYQGTLTEFDLGKKPLVEGRVGFLWKGVKFRLEDVKISGELNRDWAKKILKFEPSIPEPAEEERRSALDPL